MLSGERESGRHILGPATLLSKTGIGNISRSCESLTQVVRSCIARATTFGTSGRCSDWQLPRPTKNLVEGDPVDLGRIVAKVI